MKDLLLKENRYYFKLLLILCLLISASIGIGVNTVGLFYKTVAQDLQVSTGQYIWSNTISAITLAFAAIFIPKFLTDRNFKKMLSFGIGLYFISYLLMACSHALWQFYLIGFVKGIGSAFLAFVVVSILINQWFIKDHGLITSIVFAFSGVAGALFSPLISYIIEIMGWRAGYVFCALCILLLASPAIFYPFSLHPSSCSRLAYGQKEEKSPDKEESLDQGRFSHKQWMKYFALITLFYCSVNIVAALTQHFSTAAVLKGMSLTAAGFVVSAGMVGNIFSKCLMGILSEKMGTYSSVLFMALVNILAILLMLFGSSLSVLMAASFLYGFVYADVTVGVVLLISDVFGKSQYNSVYPLSSFISNIFFALSGSFFGSVYDIFHSYDAAFWGCLILMGMNVIIVFALSKKSTVAAGKLDLVAK